ncbi:MAG: hypothetical protein ACEQSX_08160 [Baekduiaceae bacterium]
MTTPARVLTAVLLLAALAASAPAVQAATRCSAPKVAWKLEGRTVCAKAPRATAAPSPLNAALAGSWITSAGKTAPGGRALAPQPLRRAAPLLAQTTTTLAKRILALPAKPRLRAAGGRGRVVLVDEVELDRKVQPDGTVVISKGKATVFEDESKDMSAEIEARSKDGRTRLIYRPTMDDLQSARPEVGCPTADGVVTTSSRFSTGGTAIALNGGRVLSSRTHRETFSVRGRGQVGRDARLASVDAVATYHLERFERGLQYEIKASLPARVSRDGAPVISGTPSVDVRVRALGYTAAEERAYERETAAAVVQDTNIVKTLTWQADEIRDALVIAERTWYEVPNNCADVVFTPHTDIEQGQKVAVEGFTSTREGDVESPGTITVTSVGRGGFDTIKAQTDPGDRARFTATGAAPDENRNTVYADVIATSMAGRARGFYSGFAKDVKQPKTFTGTVSSNQTTGGAGTTWTGTATYTRTSLTRLPDGTVRGWYDLTAASLSNARSWLGPSAGCRTEATGTGGRIDAGDLEVFLRPDGRREYALHYDVKLTTTFGPVDCPPGVPLPSYGGDIAAVVHSRTQADLQTGGGLRPVGADLRIAEQGLSGILGAAGMDVTADWSLTPAD